MGEIKTNGLISKGSLPMVLFAVTVIWGSGGNSILALLRSKSVLFSASCASCSNLKLSTIFCLVFSILVGVLGLGVVGVLNRWGEVVIPMGFCPISFRRRFLAATILSRTFKVVPKR